MKMVTSFFLTAVLLCTGLQSLEAAPRPKRVTIPFTLSKSGHMVIEAKVNDKKVNLVVDTAGGSSVIHSKEVKALGLKGKKTKNKVHGLGPSSQAMQMIEVTKMTIGDEDYANPLFIAVDLSHVKQVGGDIKLHGLLGIPFLVKHSAIIDYEKKTISLKRTK